MATQPTQPPQVGLPASSAAMAPLEGTTQANPAPAPASAPVVDPAPIGQTKGDVPDTAAATGSNSDTQAGILTPQAKTPQAESMQGYIDSLLQPYMSEMMQLGPEYGQEMEFLKPYLSASQPTGLAASPAYTGPDASAVNANQSALQTAETNETNTLENQPAPGFGGLAAATKQYEQTLPYQQPIQAALNYQKYLQTYEGEQPDLSSWSPEAQAAYKDILGSNYTGAGVPSTKDASLEQQIAAADAQTTSSNPGTGAAENTG